MAKSQTDKILWHIARGESGDGKGMVSRTALIRRLHGSMTADRLDDVLDAMIEEGTVEFERGETTPNGRGTAFYKISENAPVNIRRPRPGRGTVLKQKPAYAGVCMPPAMKEELQERAKANGWSLNAEINIRLHDSLKRS